MITPSGDETTLRHVLDLEIFRRAEAFVAAGEASLDRPVRWVHAGEITDISRFLTGGEVLLTAGSGIGSSPREQRAYVASIAAVGVAALAVELAGRAFTHLPPAVVAEAETRAMPLIGLRREVPFVEVSAQVLALLQEQALHEAQRSVEVQRALSERLVGGADHVGLVRAISALLGHPVVLESADHDVRAYFGTGAAAPDALLRWQAHARSSVLHDPQQELLGRCVRRPVVMSGMTWGWIHLIHKTPVSPGDVALLEHGASAVAISLLTDHVRGADSTHQQGTLVSRLLMHDVSGQGFVDRALRVGRDLRGADLQVVLLATDADRPDLEEEVAADLRGTTADVVSAAVGTAVLVVHAARDERARVALVRALRSPDRVMGLSREVVAGDLPIAVEQAKAAFFAGRPEQAYDDLGLVRLLVPLGHGPELADYVEKELGALLASDAAHGPPLMPTLVAFLESEGNKTLAAAALFIQRRTLYYRLEKISEVLALPLDDGAVRLRLRVALEAAALLQRMRAHPALCH